MCTSFFTPNLNIGVTRAGFQMSGNIPFSNDELNIIANGFATRSPTSLTTVVGMLSGPAAFQILSFLISITMCILLTVLNFISFCSDVIVWRQSSLGFAVIFSARCRPFETKY